MHFQGFKPCTYMHVIPQYDGLEITYLRKQCLCLLLFMPALWSCRRLDTEKLTLASRPGLIGGDTEPAPVLRNTTVFEGQSARFTRKSTPRHRAWARQTGEGGRKKKVGGRA